MQTKPSYKEVQGSKYTTIQFEFPGQCKIEDIRAFICQQYGEKSKAVQNPHLVAYFALIISHLEQGIQGLKSKKDSPIQLNFGLVEKTFMVSVSFMTDNAAARLVSKMMIDKCIFKTLKPIISTLKKANKDFLDSHGQEKIEKSIRFCQKKIKIFVMSRLQEIHFDNKEGSFGYKILNKRLEELNEKLELKTFTSDPIAEQNIVLNNDEYTKFPYGLSQIDPVLKSLLMTSLNGQNINFVVQSEKLWIKKKGIINQNKEQCDKFIKERLSFTSSKKVKTYKSLSTEMKAKTTESDFNLKQEKNINKKSMGILQLILQMAGCPGEQVFTLIQPLKKIQINQIEKNINFIKTGLDDVIKAK